jgi:dihydrolipoamide dehydrogenase
MDSIKTEVVVIGAGPGGYAAAFYAADLGKKVILIEKEKRLGGVCLNRGCIPSKALLYATHQIVNARESVHRGITFAEPKIELDKLRAWKETVVQKLAGGVATLAKMHNVQVRSRLRTFLKTCSSSAAVTSAWNSAPSMPRSAARLFW